MGVIADAPLKMLRSDWSINWWALETDESLHKNSVVANRDFVDLAKQLDVWLGLASDTSGNKDGQT